MTDRAWRLANGERSGTEARVRSEGHGATDAASAAEALSGATLVLDSARVGPFVDAIGAMTGKRFDVPSVVPLDALLTGQLAFDVSSGGRCKLHVTSDTVTFDLAGTVRPDGSALDVEAAGAIAAAALARRATLPAAFVPREDDRVAITLRATGDVKAPVATLTLEASEIGFRLGRPRFVPPFVVENLRARGQLVGKELVLEGSARAGRVAIGAKGGRERLDVTATDLEPSWIVAVAQATGVTFALPPDARIGAELAIAISTRRATGTVRLATASSSLALDGFGLEADRIEGALRGTLSTDDAIAAGLLAFDPRPRGGDVVHVDLALSGAPRALVVAGRLEATRLVVASGTASRLPSIPIEDVVTNIRVDAHAFAFDHGRLRAFGGVLGVEGRISFDGGATAELAFTGAAQAGDVVTDLVASVRVSPGPDPRLDGSWVRGTVALADLLAIRVLAADFVPLPEGAARLDATVDGPAREPTASGFVTIPRVRFASAKSPIFTVTDLSVLFRIDPSKLVWHRLLGRVYGGSIASSGLLGFGGSFRGIEATLSAREVSLGHVPSDRRGTPVAELARGRLALDMRFDQRGTAPSSCRGSARLDDGAFPALALAAPSLSPYGLRPPNERATAPATLDFVLAEHGCVVSNVVAAVAGCEARGDANIGWSGTIDASFVVALGEAYLAASTVLVVPAILTERLTLPVRIDGPLASPAFHADLAACLGRFMTDNRVSTFVGEAAAEVVSLLTGRAPPPPSSAWPAPGWVAPPDARTSEADSPLARELAAHGNAWDELAARLSEHRPAAAIRYRIE